MSLYKEFYNSSLQTSDILGDRLPSFWALQCLICQREPYPWTAAANGNMSVQGAKLVPISWDGLGFRTKSPVSPDPL